MHNEKLIWYSAKRKKLSYVRDTPSRMVYTIWREREVTGTQRMQSELVSFQWKPLPNTKWALASPRRWHTLSLIGEKHEPVWLRCILRQMHCDHESRVTQTKYIVMLNCAIDFNSISQLFHHVKERERNHQTRDPCLYYSLIEFQSRVHVHSLVSADVLLHEQTEFIEIQSIHGEFKFNTSRTKFLTPVNQLCCPSLCLQFYRMRSFSFSSITLYRFRSSPRTAVLCLW